VCFSSDGEELWESRISGYPNQVHTPLPSLLSLYSSLFTLYIHTLYSHSIFTLYIHTVYSRVLLQAPAIGDINGDGVLDVVIATNEGHIWAL
jgi:hypothetical protein